MIKRLYILVIVQMVCTLGFTQSPPSLPTYKDPSFSIDVRLSDLLSGISFFNQLLELSGRMNLTTMDFIHFPT